MPTRGTKVACKKNGEERYFWARRGWLRWFLEELRPGDGSTQSAVCALTFGWRYEVIPGTDEGFGLALLANLSEAGES